MGIFNKKKQDAAWNVAYEGDCRRETVRVTPPTDHPVRVRIGGISAQVRDISAGGFSVRLSEIETGDIRRFSLSLDDLGPEIKGLVEVIEKGPTGIYHCRFLDMDDDMAETIHQYALNVQRNGLREKVGRGNLGL